MENEIQGQVLVNGEWVSRPADIYRIMARARQESDAEMREPQPRPHNEVPRLAILSRTLLASPIVKYILTADVRCKKRNDIRCKRRNDCVFVGEDAVQIKEVRSFGRLRQVATKSDFKGRIMAARIFGEPRRVEVHPNYGNPDMEYPSDSEDELEEDVPEGLPPQVVVLTLDTRLLMFLWGESNHTTTAMHLRQRTVRLPAETSRFDRLGAHLAIEPRCRAIAIAADEGRFILYKTKTMAKWREDIQAGHDTTPIVDERLIPIQGRIMHMEFLSPGPEQVDGHHVILLFVLAHYGRTKITCYDWDARHDLSTATARAERVSVDFEDRNPSLVIPLNRSPDFLLVTDRLVSKYKNILSGTPRRYPIPIHEEVLQPLRPGECRGWPHWIQWERVPRTPDFSKEAFYIAREDGMVIYAQLDAANDVATSHAGHWPCTIDKAFASLNIQHASKRGLMNPDVLIAAGTTTDGQLARVGAWMQGYRSNTTRYVNHTFEFVQSIANWAPVADLVVSQLPGVQTGYERERDAVFVTGVRASHGAVSELRWGLNAIVHGIFKDDFMAGVTGVWSLHHKSDRLKSEIYASAVLVVSRPPESYVFCLRFTRTKEGSWEVFQDNNEELQNILQDVVLREYETLSACSMKHGFSVQVTRSAIRLLHQLEDSPYLAHIDSLAFSSSRSVLAATTKPEIPFVAVAFREGTQTTLQILELVPVGERKAAFGKIFDVPLVSDPTCLELLEIGGVPHVFVAITDSSVLFLKISTSGLLPVLEDKLDGHLIRGMPSVCESVVSLTGSQGQQVIVYGMRNGDILSLAIDLKVNSKHVIRMGTTAVQVTKSTTDLSTAFVTCGSDLCRVQLSKSGSSFLDIDSIWFTDPHNPGYQQSPVAALEQLWSTHLHGFIIAISGTKLLLSQLDYEIKRSRKPTMPSLIPEPSKTIPRRIETHITPLKFIFSNPLRRMVIATTETREERAPPAGYRSVRASIQLIKLDDDETETEIKIEEGEDPPKKASLVSEFPLKHYERVYSLLDWVLNDERGRIYHFLIVGTGIQESLAKETGRRLFLQVGDSGGQAQLKLKKEYVYSQPVRSMAFLSPNQLVSIIGNSLQFDEYRLDMARWEKRCEKKLPSPGVYVTTSAPFVYVSTALDSHICYEVMEGSSNPGIIFFEQVFTDGRSRTSTHHLVLSLPSNKPQQSQQLPSTFSAPSSSSSPSSHPTTLVLLADKSCSLTGLFQMPTRTYKSAAPTIFEAHLPRSITRLQRGNIRPPWRRPVHDIPHYPAANATASCTSLHSASSSGSTIAGVLADDILGSCSDGTVFTFSILSESAFKLLKFIENLIREKRKTDPEFQPCIISHRGRKDGKRPASSHPDEAEDDEDPKDNGHIKARDVDPASRDKGHARARGWHVDGDAITQFLDRDSSLKDLVYEGTDEEVGRLFSSLATGVFMGADSTMTGTDEDTATKMNLVAMVDEWITAVLMPVL
ncbi:hypothetical protein K469DRAFT_548270 [Zopfia rhizophila CBS 207.26]|uniref:RSE1/DDB1/CPSF1 first beta-propeller domain-containing protein n=1 Tax=Zopfia rhizophila CBS 207.26 TaxID=1314779 RepID=A0A6A6EWJ8_9PEZI|nr:hypothetical protein K469DRAFT_548270 [Zopfia rhizophila CBS 207.26]